MSTFAFVNVPKEFMTAITPGQTKRRGRSRIVRLTVDDNLWPGGRTSHSSDIFTRTRRKCLIFVMAECLVTQ